MEYSKKVAISAADEYDVAKIKNILSAHFEALDIDIARITGKNVVKKPNLVIKTPP